MKMKGWKGTIYETNSLLMDGIDGMGGIDGIAIQQNGFRPQNLTPE
jgi:hypothetical protein